MARGLYIIIPKWRNFATISPNSAAQGVWNPRPGSGIQISLSVLLHYLPEGAHCQVFYWWERG